MGDGGAVFEGDDEILVHDESQSGTHGDVRRVVLLPLRHVLLVGFAEFLLAPEAHVASARHHRSVAEGAEPEGDVLVPEGEVDESPAQFGGVGRHVESYDPVAHDAPDRAVSPHTVLVAVLSHHGDVGQHVVGRIVAEGALVVQPVGEGQHVIADQREVLAQRYGISVERVAGAQPFGGCDDVSLRPDSTGGGSFLVARVIHEAQPYAAREASVGFRVIDEAPSAV